MDGKLISGKEEFWLTDLTSFLLKAGQGDQTSPTGWERMKTPVSQLLRVRDSGQTDLARFLLKWNNAEMNMEAQKSGLRQKELQRA